MADVPDSELVALALAGDGDAFGKLAERYYRMISVLAYQKTGQEADAEDLVQEALVRAYKGLHGLRDPGAFPAWLYRITLKLCIDYARRRERVSGRLRSGDGALEEAESRRLRRADASGLLRDLSSAEESESMLRHLGSLPDKYRLVVTLRYVKQMSYKEMAEHLGEPDGTVANRLHRAMGLLKRRAGSEDRSQREGA